MESTMGSPVMYQPPVYPMQQPPMQQMLPVQAPAQSVSAVSINVPNAKAYGSAPQPSNSVAPMYNYAPNPNFNIPNAEIYGEEPSAYTKPMVAPCPIITPKAPKEVKEAPTPPPPSIVDKQPAPAKTETPVEQPKVKEDTEKKTEKIDIAALNKSLKSDNLEEQSKAIEKIAEVGQSHTPQSAELINEEIFNNLKSIVTKDTSKLPDKTPKQIELAKKQESGATLTDQEKVELQKPSLKEMAEGNKIIGMWTMAIIQKNLREEVNKELKAENQPPVALYQLPGMPEIENNVKTGSPEVKSAGIQALRYLAQPEDNEVLTGVFNTVIKTETNPAVKADAQNALNSIPKAPKTESKPATAA